MSNYHIITYGCQMNKNDSERLERVFITMGMNRTETVKDADVIMINTCSVRQSAEDRIFGHTKNLAKLKTLRPNLVIGVTGCMPGRDRNGVLKKKLIHADLFFPIEDMVKLPVWLAELNPEFANSGILETDYLQMNPVRRTQRQNFVTIQTGCNKFCTYCVVPFSRGYERNRTVEDILKEAREVVSNGCIEITLLGQTVNSFSATDPEQFSRTNPYKNHFAALLYELNHIPHLKRIHFTAPHPLHMNDEVISALTLPLHINFLHLPVQSGDNDILRKMNRRYSREYYIETIKKIRERIPNIAIGTDIIVGFCGETDAQFEHTVDMYTQCDFDISYTAMYSPRSGTVGYRAFYDDVSRSEKKRRWNILQQIMEETVLRKNQLFVGKTVSVLADDFKPVVGETRRGWVMGNSREMKRVRFPGIQEDVGNIFDIAIERSLMWILYGKKIHVGKFNV